MKLRIKLNKDGISFLILLGLFIVFSIFRFASIDRAINRLESVSGKELKEATVRFEALEKHIPQVSRYISLVKELSAVGKTLTPTEIVEIAQIILTECVLNEKIGLTPDIILAIMEKESNFDPTAISSAKAYGIMQILSTTFNDHAESLGYSRFTLDLAHNPVVNTQVGIRELVKLRKYWLENGVDNWKITLSSYYWGVRNTWHLLSGEKTTPSLSYGEDVLKRAEKYKNKGIL